MISNSRHHRAGESRSGYVLVLVVMLLFGFMAMAALVIDLGLARLTQRQMQTAVDGASLEGLRYRDSLWPEASDPSSTEFDSERRNAARLTVARMFDDNLLEDEEDPFSFGAGPIIGFSGGVGPSILAASQRMTIPTPPLYKPTGSQQLKINPGNQAEGDMLTGNYNASELAHNEDADYTRTDFTPDQDGDAFLVRTRRSNENFFSSDVASNGPALPYLFARGSLFNRRSALGQAKLSDGMEVRATGIAHSQPVVCLGENNPLLLGIAIEFDVWDQEVQFQWTSTSLANSGMIGEAVQPNPNSTPSGDQSGYVAIYSSQAFNRVIGFGFASIDAATNLVTKLPFSAAVPQITVENASAVFCRPLDGTIPANELASVFSERTNRLVKTNRDDILLAPVSGR